jgi:hypothetical protein
VVEALDEASAIARSWHFHSGSFLNRWRSPRSIF